MPPIAAPRPPRLSRTPRARSRRAGKSALSTTAAAALCAAACLTAAACASPAPKPQAAEPAAAASNASQSLGAAAATTAAAATHPASASPSPTAKQTLATSGGAGAAAAPSSILTSKPINLALWQLILPVDSSGAASGTDAAVDHPAKLASPWLVMQSNGSLLFWAPAGGATTGHSLHSRTELDYLSDFTAGQGDHTLTATVLVSQLPTVSHNIVIGQVHGFGSTYSAAPFVELEYNGSKLELAVESKPKLGGSTGPSDGEVTSTYTVLSGLALNQPLAYTITADGGELTATAELYTASGAKEHYGSVSVAIPSDWKGVPVNFDAGDYEQDDAASSHSGGGKVAFYTLNAD
jgi:hypothetical protein